MSPADARRRWFGSFFLISALGMTVWGQTLLKPWLVKRPVVFLLYWVGVFLCVFAAMVIALLDLFATRRRARREQQEIIDRIFRETQQGSAGAPERKPPERPEE